MSDVVLESDRERLIKEGDSRLKICESCGWYDSQYAHNNCRPDRGRAGAALARELPDANPTKLGYGEGCVTFELDEDTHVSFEIGLDNSIRLREVFMLEDLSTAQAAEIVRAIRKVLGK